MKAGCYLIILTGMLLGLSAVAQQDDDVRRALRGTSPSTTLGTGIGQVVQPVGKPAIHNPMAPKPVPDGGNKTTVQKEPIIEEEKGPLDPEKVKGEYKLEGLPEKEDKKGSKKRVLTPQTLSAQTGTKGAYSMGGTPLRRNAVRFEKNTPPKPMRIPHGELPKVQTIPY